MNDYVPSTPLEPILQDPDPGMHLTKEICHNYRIILHVDMDSFYASVEVREHPDLKGKPVVIGADPREGSGRGVVCTCSYEARKYGVRSAMPISHAYQLCPNAVFLPPRFPVYTRASERVMAVLRRYSEKFEQVSIDEAYLDLSYLKNFADAELVARDIKKEILATEQLSCSIGIGPGKVVAKIASDMQKPGGLVVITPGLIKEILYPLPVTRIPGVGRKTGDALVQRGISTVGDLAEADIQQLMGVLGRWAVPLQKMAKGIDDSEVRGHSDSKSISREMTFETDIDSPSVILETLEGMARELGKDLAERNLYARTVTVKIRFSDFATFSRSRSLPCPTRDVRAILSAARDLALPLISQNRVRLAGLRLSSLSQLDRNQTTIGEFCG
ncbi:MAG TPA: DNA polymerase IV [Methanolinea sp.]|nr:DNA polymerase IV [Methanolinea sp.]HQK55963.1 DNA polymerase IV [Methanolinea sp.]